MVALKPDARVPIAVAPHPGVRDDGRNIWILYGHIPVNQGHFVSVEKKQENLSTQLAKKLAPLALVIGFVIAIVIPAIYCQLEVTRVKNVATLYSRLLADDVRRLASEAPQLWKYPATKYSQMIDNFFPHREILKITLTDEKKNMIHQYDGEAQSAKRWSDFPIDGDPAPVVFNHRTIGETKVSISGHSLLLSALFAFFICGGIGTGFALLVYRIPLKVVSSLEREIIGYHQSLEEKVEQRTAELKEATEKALSLAERAAAASRTKSEFLANMSHELRTPLNHIIGFTELVVDEKFGPLSPQQMEFLDDVIRSGRHLLALINDILDLSKVEAGKLDLDPTTVHLRPLIDNCLMMVKERALKHRIKISTDMVQGPDTFQADERKLKQILYNVLSNAVKFTPDGGSIWVRVAPESGSPAGQPALRFTIGDTGIGVPAEDLERIFLPFVQADSSVGRKYQGTGLGLALARKLVELHGGRIWAESDGRGKGSHFHFILPLEKDSA